MSAITLDTYQFVDILKSEGFTEQQAKGLLKAVEKIDVSSISTRNDILMLKNEIANLEVRMMRSIVALAALQIAIMGVTIAVIKLF